LERLFDIIKSIQCQAKHLLFATLDIILAPYGTHPSDASHKADYVK
jgi:hypothetical protein